jgi:hypothetical protein
MYEYEYRPLMQLFMVEFIFFCALWIFFFYKRYSFFYFDRAFKRHTDAIIEYLTARISKKNVFVPKSISRKQALLKQLEVFDKKFSDEQWCEIKRQLLEKYLFPYALKKVRSLFWEKRMFAVRCFALSPSKAWEESLIRLVQDKKILIRVYAAKTLIHLESERGIYVILKEISKFTGYCFYLFQDFFQNSSSRVIDIIIKSANDPKLLHASLKVLSPLVVNLPILFLKNILLSENIEVKLLAVELFCNNPLKDGEDVLIELLSDKNEKIIKQAIKGLSFISTNKGIEKLQEIFHYSHQPKLILEAARALDALGKLKEEKESEYTDYVFRFR